MNASNVALLDADGHSALWNALFSGLESNKHDFRSGEDSGRLECVAALLQVLEVPTLFTPSFHLITGASFCIA